MPVSKSHRLVEFARTMRHNSTLAERKLWRHLRRPRFAKYNFRRQQPIGTFIVDFVSFIIKLIVEVDGGYHDKSEQKKKDKIRTTLLHESRFTIIRFMNNAIEQDMPNVLNRIEQKCIELSQNLDFPSPLAGEGGATDRSRG